MASSKVMASTSPPNPDLPRQSATPSSVHSSSSSGLAQTTPLSSVSNLLQQPNPLPNPNLNSTTNNHHLQYSDRSSNSPFGSMNMEEILKNIYSEPDSLVDDAGMSGVAGIDGGTGGGVVKNVANKTVDEVWKEIVTGGGESGEPRMTLEDFLTKAGAVSEEDVRVHNSAPPPLPLPVQAPAAGGPGGYGVEAMMTVQFPVAPGPVVHMQNGPGGFGLESQLGFGNGMVAVASSALGGNGGNGSATGRGKRRAVPVEELAIDKATQQKQRRMIKNRESAARSRERKQAYTVELESLVTQLEEENARLLREEVEQNKERYKQLMENLIPVVEKRRPPRVLRRVKSSIW